MFGIDKFLTKQMNRFIIVGFLSTVINYFVNLTLILIMISPEYASGAGYITGLLIGYPLNKNWSFESKYSGQIKKECIKYFLLYGVSFFVNSVLAYYSYEIFSYLHFFSNGLALKIFYYLPVITVTTIINFLGCKYMVFIK